MEVVDSGVAVGLAATVGAAAGAGGWVGAASAVGAAAWVGWAGAVVEVGAAGGLVTGAADWQALAKATSTRAAKWSVRRGCMALWRFFSGGAHMWQKAALTLALPVGEGSFLKVLSSGAISTPRPWRIAVLSSVRVSILLTAALVLSACSSGAAPAAPAEKPAPTAANPAPAQTAQTIATGGQSPAAPADKGSSQASGEIDPRAGEAPAAPIVARSRTTGRPITLEIWLTDWEQSTQSLFNEQLVPAFEAANPDIAVNVQYLDWRVFTEKLIAAHAGGVLPDIYQAGAEYVAPLATRGMALDIDNFIAAWGQKDDFYESAWSTVTYKGKTYGVPVLSAPQTLMVRKDMLQEVGVASAPTTWNE